MSVAQSEMVRRLLAAGTPKRSAKPAQSDDAMVLAAVQSATVASWCGIPTCAEARALCSLSKARFDAAALRLQSAGKVAMTNIDDQGHRSAEALAGMVTDRKSFYNTVKVRA